MTVYMEKSCPGGGGSPVYQSRPGPQGWLAGWEGRVALLPRTGFVNIKGAENAGKATEVGQPGFICRLVFLVQILHIEITLFSLQPLQGENGLDVYSEQWIMQ